MTPRATLRLQLHAGFTFDDALAALPDHAALGISHLYLSPIFTARPGSTHGYDAIDFAIVSPALGGEDGLRRLAATARRHGMGLVIDIVPNHMGVDPGNAWWQDVLRLGPASPHAASFDIDWHALQQLTVHVESQGAKSTGQAPQDGRGDPSAKLLLPVLGKPYGDALAEGELRLGVQDGPGGPTAVLRYGDSAFPLDPDSIAGLDLGAARGGSPAGFDPATDSGRAALHALLEAQHYRLAWWRMAADAINWRRFFEINELAGLRVEDEAVFAAVHVLVFRLYREGLIDGVRVDHVDGLADPAAYCQALRGQLEALHAGRPDGVADGVPWIVVEKILAPDESLPIDWQVDGTTGYEFMNDAAALLTDPAGQAPLEALWAVSTVNTDGFGSVARAARRLMMSENLASEFNAEVRRLERLALADLRTRDIAAPMVRRALAALLEQFTVYRTYMTTPGTRGSGDRRTLEQAFAHARRSLRVADHAALDAIDRWLGGAALGAPGSALDALQRAAIVKFQQLSSPLAAKAVEDTAFYRHAPLLSLSEVGNDPERFALPPETFHARMAAAGETHPHRLLATATHDHKRGEDARVRIAALSEVPAPWAEAVTAWRAAASRLHRQVDGHAAPCPADELMLFQTLLGAWPPTLQADDAEGARELLDRVAEWQVKALREAKRQTNWIAPNEAYEAACQDYLRGLATLPLDDGGDRTVLAAIATFAHGLAPAGALNGLAQTLLRMTVPGVPDLYQGCDLWDWSLVDPDNRRPVDQAVRHAALVADAPLAALLPHWRDGRVKQALIRKTLALRRAQPALFAEGGYQPLALTGRHAERALAFLRDEQGRDGVLVVVPRLAAGLLDPLAALPMVPADAWDDTAVQLPPDWLAASWTDALDGRSIALTGVRLPLRELLARLPLGLLHARRAQPAVALQSDAAAIETRDALTHAAQRDAGVPAASALQAEEREAGDESDKNADTDRPGASQR